MSSVPFSVRLDQDLKASLDEEAKREDITASQLATRAIRSMLDAKTAKRKAIDEALLLADKGEFISQESMNAWIDSWDVGDELPMPEADVIL